MSELILQIYPDMDPESPREWSNVGTMVCAHRRYDLGGEQTDDPQEYVAQLVEEKYEGFLDWLDEWLEEETRDLTGEAYFRRQAELAEEKIYEMFQKYYMYLPLYLYDHSGITMSTGPFSCPWDSGQVGIIYVSYDKLNEELHDESKYPLTIPTVPETVYQTREEHAIAILKGEVETYDQYLRGDVWGFKLVTLVDDEELDSCWGFYGDDYRTNGMLDSISSEDEVRITKVQYMEPTMISTMQVSDEEPFENSMA